MTTPATPSPTGSSKLSAAMCWWCGANAADSREHATKAADIKARYGPRWDAAASPVLVAAAGKNLRIQGAKSDAVKFSASLCQPCNNARSQPYDLAYDTFSDYLFRNHSVVESARSLRFDRVFGSTYRQSVVALIAYYMKVFGCALVDEGRQPDAQFVSLIGQPNTSPFQLSMSVNSTVRDQLGSQTLSPPALYFVGRDGVVGTMMNGFFQIRMWWKARPHGNECGTLFAGPIPEIVVPELPWDAEVRVFT